MRWGRVGLVVMVAVMVPARAQASCPGSDGSLPGSSAEVYSVSAAGETLYVDDRDFFDLDGDDDAGGLWIYRESNGQEGLQRGGSRPTKGLVPDVSIVVDVGATFREVYDEVCPSSSGCPVLPHGPTLFPGPITVGTQDGWFYGDSDECVEGTGPLDTLIF